MHRGVCRCTHSPVLARRVPARHAKARGPAWCSAGPLTGSRALLTTLVHVHPAAALGPLVSCETAFPRAPLPPLQITLKHSLQLSFLPTPLPLPNSHSVLRHHLQTRLLLSLPLREIGHRSEFTQSSFLNLPLALSSSIAIFDRSLPPGWPFPNPFPRSPCAPVAGRPRLNPNPFTSSLPGSRDSACVSRDFSERTAVSPLRSLIACFALATGHVPVAHSLILARSATGQPLPPLHGCHVSKPGPVVDASAAECKLQPCQQARDLLALVGSPAESPPGRPGRAAASGQP